MPSPSYEEAAKPGVLFLELTNHCNMHCTFCPSDLLKKPRRNLDDTNLRSFLDQAHALGMRPPILLNVLGEPLLNKKLYDDLDLFEREGHPVTLITNMTLLKDKTLVREILKHNNTALTLSLQTVTRDSYRMRGYKKAGLKDLFQIAFEVIEEKFRMGSSAQLEIHVASNHVVSHDPTIQSDVSLDFWKIFKCTRQEERWITRFLGKLERLAERIKAEYPRQYSEELAFALEKYKDHIPARVAVTRETLPPDFHHLKDEFFWGAMFLPNVLLRFKQLELWSRDLAFLKSVFPKDTYIFVEERTEPRSCIMAGNLGLLANGEYVLCCLDYEAEMELGNIRDTGLKDVLASKKRRDVLQNAMSQAVCRRCKGTIFVFHTKPLKSKRQAVDKFGQGWHVFEPGLYGLGGRWTRGTARAAYIFPRLMADKIKLKFYSVFESSMSFQMKIYSYDDAHNKFHEEAGHTFRGVQNQVSEFTAPFDFKPARLYKIELSSPTFIPHELFKNNDFRRLGIAILKMEVLHE
jgi:organic radical activating enzyme